MNSNLSLDSSVGSQDDEDQISQADQSIDSFQNTSTNSSNRANNSSRRSNGSSRGADRYNHYRRDAPARVKPWMRDKAVTTGAGSGVAAAGAAAVSNNRNMSKFRFGSRLSSSAANSCSFGGSSMSVGSNSCANSVCSHSSFPETNDLPKYNTSSMSQNISNSLSSDHLPHQQEVQLLSPDSSLLDDTSGIQFTPEKNNSQLLISRSGITDADIEPKQSQQSSSVKSRTDDTESTEETPQREAIEKQSAGESSEVTNTSMEAMPPPPSRSTAGETKYPDEKKLEEADDESDGVDDNDNSTAKKEKEQEVYDVLRPVLPTSYNPMARIAAPSRTQQPTSVETYAARNQPTPLATEQAALVQDAIAEENSEEENSFEESSPVGSRMDGENEKPTEEEPAADEEFARILPPAQEYSMPPPPSSSSSLSSSHPYHQLNSMAVPPPPPDEEILKEMHRLRTEMTRLENSNAELLENIRLAEVREELQRTKYSQALETSRQRSEELEQAHMSLVALESSKESLTGQLERAEKSAKELEAKYAEATIAAHEQAETMQQLREQLEQVKKSLEAQQAKNSDMIASSEAQAEMLEGLGEELKQMEEEKQELQQKLKEAQEAITEQETKNSLTSKVTEEATSRMEQLDQEIRQLNETNAGLLKKIRLVEEREKAQASRDESVTLVHIGEMPVDVSRLRIKCQKYFSRLRITQLKSHCVQDKSPAKIVVSYQAKDKQAIDIKSLLDKSAAIEAQDTTYLFKSLDTFNKGHFHTHKLLIPWKITSTDGTNISRSEFFAQVWQQLGQLTVTVGEQKTVIPLFQDCLGTLIPLPNAVLEGKLQMTPVELERTFLARIAPYYRAVGRLMVQCVAATADDNTDHSLKIASHTMPPILRHKLFRGVGPNDSNYPMQQLLDHAFSLLGMSDMTEDKAFEYFGIDVRACLDKSEATTKVRQEIYEMWINERSLALKALEEGLTLNGLADMSFCCGMVPLEAVDEILFSV